MENRPIVAIELSDADNPISIFMHQTLRPILKQQHGILCALMRSDKNILPHEIFEKTETKNMVFLKIFLQKNTALRSTLIGIIIGRFTPDEFRFYLENQKEIRRRIIEMSISRFLSEFDLKK